MTLRFTSDLERLADVRAFIREQLTGRVGPSATADLVQAVDETVTNVIVHGYRGRAGAIEVEVEIDPGDVTVRVRDACPAFDPTTVPEPDTATLAHPRPGGMGIHLARTMTDGMRHRILPEGGNELTLVKRHAVARGGAPPWSSGLSG